MSDAKDKERARQRAAVVFAVRSGQITAEEGARKLGVSRKTYYAWGKPSTAGNDGGHGSSLTSPAVRANTWRRMPPLLSMI